MRATRLGVGGHTRFVDFDVERLVESIRGLDRDDVRARAAALGEKLKREDGLAAAVQTIAETATRAART
jgi:sterol 3beta-glucosyltransferase